MKRALPGVIMAGLTVSLLAMLQLDVHAAQQSQQTAPQSQSQDHGASQPPQSQTPAPAGAHGAEGPVTGMRMGFGTHAVSPEVAARGKSVYSVNCSFCHGSDAAGGAVGPNLLRSAIVLEDQNGETIAPIVHGSLSSKGMPRIDISETEITDVAGFLHSLHVVNYSAAPEKPIDIVVGNAAEGRKTFDSMCASCHSVDKDLAHIGGNFTNPRTLQQAWLLPGGPGRIFPGQPPPPASPGFHVPPMTVSVALPTGTVQGTLERIDDFYVALKTSDGTVMSFDREGESPKVTVNDPMKAHRELLPRYTDKEIHDITAYLVTVK